MLCGQAQCGSLFSYDCLDDDRRYDVTLTLGEHRAYRLIRDCYLAGTSIIFSSVASSTACRENGMGWYSPRDHGINKSA